MPADFVFEVSTEAGRKIGGIYTVLSSKAKVFHEKFDGNLVFVGFWDKPGVAAEFVPEAVPASWQPVVDQLRLLNIECHYGRWTRGANARIIFVDARRFAETWVDFEGPKGTSHDVQLNAVKYWLWKEFGVDSLMMGWDFNENVPWAYAVGLLLEGLLSLPEFSGKRVAGHFHEWMTGPALLYCRSKNLPIATVFTTHATVLGRSLSSYGRDVLSEAQSNPDSTVAVSEAYNVKVEGKHLIEVACARNADCFTTVSETVADEVRYVLGKRPDVVMPNGLDLTQFREKRKVEALTRYARGALEDFVHAYFTPYYDVCYHESLLVYASGRYEFRNKGYDLFVQALGLLNERLKREGAVRPLVAFVFAPSSVVRPRPFLVHNYLLFSKLMELVHEVRQDLPPCSRLSELQSKLPPALADTVRGIIAGLHKEGDQPPVSAFELAYPHDSIEEAVRRQGLFNAASDPVKIVLYPTYLRPGDGLLDLDYYDALAGLDVGVFPSRYEPFGYTPVEAAANLNVSITTDATGFGRLVQSQDGEPSPKGIEVVAAVGKSDVQIAQAIADKLYAVYSLPKEELKRLQEDAFRRVRALDWNELVSNYLKAQDVALERRASRPS